MAACESLTFEALFVTLRNRWPHMYPRDQLAMTKVSRATTRFCAEIFGQCRSFRGPTIDLSISRHAIPPCTFARLANFAPERSGALILCAAQFRPKPWKLAGPEIRKCFKSLKSFVAYMSDDGECLCGNCNHYAAKCPGCPCSNCVDSLARYLKFDMVLPRSTVAPGRGECAIIRDIIDIECDELKARCEPLV